MWPKVVVQVEIVMYSAGEPWISLPMCSPDAEIFFFPPCGVKENVYLDAKWNFRIAVNLFLSFRALFFNADELASSSNASEGFKKGLNCRAYTIAIVCISLLHMQSRNCL